MSVCFVVVPLITAAGWPIFAGAAAAVAASMGLRALKSGLRQKVQETRRPVALELENVESLGAAVRDDDSLSFGDGVIRVTVAKDARGKCTVHVSGEGKTDDELRALGSTFLKKVMQQYAYQRVAAELKKKGFTIVQEEVSPQETIRLRFRKFE